MEMKHFLNFFFSPDSSRKRFLRQIRVLRISFYSQIHYFSENKKKETTVMILTKIIMPNPIQREQNK